MAAYGNNRIHMPNLNRLTSEAVVFKRACVTQPVCTPSRSSILTGLYPHTTGCKADNTILPEWAHCLPEMVSEGSFTTGYYGKWHLGDEVFCQHGFDEWRSIQDDYTRHYRPERDRAARSTHYQFLVENGFTPGDDNTFTNMACTKLPEEFSKTAYLAREASQFIQKNRHHPFILFVGFHEPHPPYHGPRDHQYDPREIQLPQNFNHPPTEEQHPKAIHRYRSFYENGYRQWNLRDEKQWLELISNYWGLCSQVDTHVGMIIDTLRKYRIYDETLIVFTADHGDMMGSHRLLQKSVMFQESIMVPLVIKIPGQEKSAVINGPVSHVDLLPTILEYMDEKIPGHLQGKSLKPIIGGGPDTEYQAIIEWNNLSNDPGSDGLDEDDEETAAKLDPTRTIVTKEGWRYTCSPMGRHELYNLNEDPMEIHNLARADKYSELMTHLFKKIQCWQRQTEDNVYLPRPF